MASEAAWILTWVIAVAAAGGSGSGATVAEDPAPSRDVRAYRSRLADPSPQVLRQAVGEMTQRPHSEWVLLMSEALLRAVRSVEQAQERLPGAERELTELRLQRKEAQAATSPSKVKRLDAQLSEVTGEFNDIQAQLRTQMSARELLLRSIARVSRNLEADGRERMGSELSRRLASMRDPLDRVTWLEILGAAPAPASTFALARLVRDPVETPDALVAALKALVAIREPSSLPAAIHALDHRDWRVRSEAVELIRVLHRRSSISFLLDRLEVAEGRLRDDIGVALNSLTGQKFAADPRFWRDWWTRERDRFQMPAEAAPRVVDLADTPGGVHFYGISTQSRRVLFVLDVSGSMNQPARSYDGKGGTASRKIDVARRNLRGALMSLPEDAVFNVIVYSDRAEPFFEEVQPATHANKTAAIERMMAREPAGGTNIYAALVEAFRQAERVERSTRRDDSPRVDTLYFLTDGQPTVGTVKEPQLILREAESRNALQRIRINTVGVGAHDKDFMRKLAEQNGGLYVST